MPARTKAAAPKPLAASTVSHSSAASPAAAKLSVPKPGLRERKKAATMHKVQTIAMELFQEQGFDVVSVEQVAEAAEVSPSTIYRYFKTKEGLVLRDEYDDRLLESLRHYLSQGLGLAQSVERTMHDISEEHFVRDAALTKARIRLCFAVPSIEGAVALSVNRQVDEIAQVVAEASPWDFPQARVMASALVWTIVAVLRNWHDDGCRLELRSVVEESQALLPLLEQLEPGE
ncbi:HTH-type transcriptional repressor Bm3R1 [Actinomyces bovis]|uniref:HTH-type transcriptional repressor Bm3R1 n=1 Tax=Actinomyces bovis TaxID=1658 RepID=A0ABY1VNQ0_9ACTO|nr:TetR family transcriptional regulator [Actinomyces bovis]SPT53377.1 HTH-type transcriptional repressor Bm3R1 [Actinomyces bovis]VEG52770.1 HTH-type transcriptional repressor Bm3R1 [Actinomyces israelii]